MSFHGNTIHSITNTAWGGYSIVLSKPDKAERITLNLANYQGHTPKKFSVTDPSLGFLLITTEEGLASYMESMK